MRFVIDQDGRLGLREALTRLEADGMRIVAANLAEETIALIQDGFEKSQAPDGSEWDALLIRTGGQPLRDTGGLEASWHQENVSPEGFEVLSSKDYAGYHQGGTGIHGPKRKRIEPINALALRIPTPRGGGRKAGGASFFQSVEGSPARPMIPDDEIPETWANRYDEAVADTLKEFFE